MVEKTLNVLAIDVFVLAANMLMETFEAWRSNRRLNAVIIWVAQISYNSFPLFKKMSYGIPEDEKSAM